MLILAIALLGLNLLTGFNGQISLGHGAFFAIGGYGAAILTAKLGVPYYLAIPLASLVCFGAGFLFGFPALRFGGLYLALATFALAVATPQILAYKGFDAWTGGSSGVSLIKPHAPFALPLTTDQWLYLVCLLCGRAPLFRGAQPRLEPRRPGAGRAPRPADRGRGDGRQRGALQDDLLRRQRALCRRRGGPERARGRLRVAGKLRPAAVAVVSGRDRGRRARLARRRRCSARCSSSSCPISPTSFRSASARAPRRCRARSTACC